MIKIEEWDFYLSKKKNNKKGFFITSNSKV